MATNGSRKMFVNLAVRDLNRSMEFFEKLGFRFNPQFSDEKAACMIINEDAYAMLLHEPFFRSFTHKDTCDPARSTEAMMALSCATRDEVNDMVGKALVNGGSRAMDSTDLGFMYGWSFYDPDGHHWELFWMDPEHIHHEETMA